MTDKPRRINLGNFTLSAQLIRRYRPLMAEYARNYDAYLEDDMLILVPDYGDAPDPAVQSNVPKSERISPSLYAKLAYSKENKILVLYIKDAENLDPEYLKRHLKQVSQANPDFETSLKILRGMLKLNPSESRQVSTPQYVKHESMKRRQQVSRIKRKLAKLRDILIKMQ